jgi:hypothetical protein
MLALDDAALARFVIGATRIAPTAREAWLMKFAERAEQPKTCTFGPRADRRQRGSRVGRLARRPARPRTG